MAERPVLPQIGYGAVRRSDVVPVALARGGEHIVQLGRVVRFPPGPMKPTGAGCTLPVLHVDGDGHGFVGERTVVSPGFERQPWLPSTTLGRRAAMATVTRRMRWRRLELNDNAHQFELMSRKIGGDNLALLMVSQGAPGYPRCKKIIG